MTLLFIDTVLIVCLLFSIKYVRDFFEKYKSFIKVKDDLINVMRHTENVMKKGEEIAQILQKNVKTAATDVIPHLPKIEILKDDLQFFMDQGDTMIRQLEHLVREAKRIPMHSMPIHQASEMLHKKTPRKPPQKVNLRDVMDTESGGKEAQENHQPGVTHIHTTVNDDGSRTERRGFYTSIRRVR